MRLILTDATSANVKVIILVKFVIFLLSKNEVVAPIFKEFKKSDLFFFSNGLKLKNGTVQNFGTVT